MGKRNLEAALRTTPELDVQVEWLPYFLRNNIPEQGVLKPGGPGPHQVGDRIKTAGEQAGINFTGMCDRFPNTTKAHAAMTFALESAGPEVQNKLQEVLFRHYFTDGKYPDIPNLVEAAVEVGLPEAQVREALESKKYEPKVKQEAAEISRQGVTGVPYFFINGKGVFSGAQPPYAFVQELRNA